MGVNISNHTCISSESYTSDSLPQKSCIPLERVSTKVFQRMVKCQVLDFFQSLFSFLLTWRSLSSLSYDKTSCYLTSPRPRTTSMHVLHGVLPGVSHSTLGHHKCRELAPVNVVTVMATARPATQCPDSAYSVPSTLPALTVRAARVASSVMPLRRIVKVKYHTISILHNF